MQLQEIPIIKSDARGTIWNCWASSFITRKQWTISADHTHNDPEIDYLVVGEIELTLGNETQIVKAPIAIHVESNVYHKIVALTDIEMVFDRKG